MTYSSGVVIDFLDYAGVFSPVTNANNVHRGRMVRLIESGEHLKATMKTYRECDKDGNGKLTWNNGEIRDFITACFFQHGLSPPNEEQMFTLYSKFDKDRNNALDMRECLEMVDALFRTTFIVDGSGAGPQVIQSQPVRSFVRAASPSSNVPVAGQRVVQTVVQRGVSPAPAPTPMELQATTLRMSSPRREMIVSPRSLPQNVLQQQDLFDKLDTNHDGVISRRELEYAQQTGVLSEAQRTLAGRSPSPGGYQFSNVFGLGGSAQAQRPGVYPATGVQRMHSGGILSPGMPLQGATILGQPISPRGAIHRSTSPDGA